MIGVLKEEPSVNVGFDSDFDDLVRVALSDLIAEYEEKILKISFENDLLELKKGKVLPTLYCEVIIESYEQQIKELQKKLKVARVLLYSII
ncbi:hypothetical protein [Metabacillus arenae]|uniref:Uncharacterized protein n=1 Tax=Metabacillus arenae TaxID=2771434 RepID=A0A926NSD9_9BACI|nr:hypothetical protein [Metabacillus arenae]MBD1383031.1 hypothetical protein [Metabacillus arenae]